MGALRAEGPGSEHQWSDRLRFRTHASVWSVTRRGWREFHAHLAKMHVFAGCARRQIWRVARWGDVIEAAPGDVLALEDRSIRWFFVILSGSVKLTRRGREIATLHRGGHFGELAVVGFGPQPATVTAIEPTVLFVIGRRYVLTLAATDPSIQRALFPEVTPPAYRAFVRRIHGEGQSEWARLRPHYRVEKDVAAMLVRERPPGRRLSWADAVEVLTKHDQDPRAAAATKTVYTPPVWKRSTYLIAAAVVAFLLSVFAVVYHPPLAVVSAAQPIDVTQDITITGTKVDRPTGRYLLTSVHIGRPNLAGVVFAKARGRTVVSVHSNDSNVDLSTERRLAREAFLNSHRLAIALAEKSLDVDPAGIAIVIRDRKITGPSAGLTYALAIMDMLDPADLADGRVIAATGELSSRGRIGPVAFVSLKVDVARDGGAHVFLVPARQVKEAGAKDMTILGVKDFESAVRALKRAG